MNKLFAPDYSPRKPALYSYHEIHRKTGEIIKTALQIALLQMFKDENKINQTIK